MSNIIDDLIGIALILAVFAGAAGLATHAVRHEAHVVNVAKDRAVVTGYAAVMDDDAFYEVAERGDD